MTESDIVNIAAITEDQAEEYAQDIYESGHTKGFYKNYRYQVYVFRPVEDATLYFPYLKTKFGGIIINVMDQC